MSRSPNGLRSSSIPATYSRAVASSPTPSSKPDFQNRGHRMSRLDSFIGRMTAQRDILNHIHAKGMLIEEGAVLEIGLGNGRTYSHLRELFPERRIVVFD